MGVHDTCFQLDLKSGYKQTCHDNSSVMIIQIIQQHVEQRFQKLSQLGKSGSEPKLKSQMRGSFKFYVKKLGQIIHRSTFWQVPFKMEFLTTN